MCTWSYTVYTSSYGRYILRDGDGCLLKLACYTLLCCNSSMVGVHRTRYTLYHHGMLGLFTSYCFLVFGEDRWQVPMGQLRNFICIMVHQTWDKGLIVFPDRVLRTLTSIQIPDFNGLGIGLFSITLHSFLQGEKLLTWNLDWGDQTPN